MTTIVIPPPAPPRAIPPWGWLADALKLVSEEELRAAGKLGEIEARIVHHYRGDEGPPSPEHWSGEFDPERSRLRRDMHLDFDGRVSQRGGWATVQVNLDSVRRRFGLDRQPTEPIQEETRGTKKTYDWEQAGLDILGRIYRQEIPEPTEPGDVKQLYADWFAAQDMYPKKSVLYQHAEKLWKEIG